MSEQIAVCMPSRALVHSRAMQDIIANTLNYEVNWYFAHGLPIPDCHNALIEEALEDKNDYIWLVEDDMHIPPGTLKKMFKVLENNDVVHCDYPVGRSREPVIHRDSRGELLYGGLGCLLLRPMVFETIGLPHFRTDYEYNISDDKMTPNEAVIPNAHGLLDPDFWYRVRQHEEIRVAQGPDVGQYYLISPELPKYGNGTALEYVVETAVL